MMSVLIDCIFFFKQKTAYEMRISDWSSDVCSSDLKAGKADDYLKSLGADQIVSRQSLSVGSRPLESATWGGAVDNLGGDTLAMLTRTVNSWGNIASIGLAQSHELQTTVMPFILRGVSILGVPSVSRSEERRVGKKW